MPDPDLPRLADANPAMQELDAFPWAAGLTFRTFGLTMGLRVDDPALLQLLPPYLPYGWEPIQPGTVERLYSLRRETAPDNTDSYVLYKDAEESVRWNVAEEVLHSLEREIRWELAENAPRRTFVHAGVVGWRGQAIVLPGTSGVGKSTLVAELVRAGATYFSDEYAVLDSRGWVHPFATHLQIRRAGDQRQERETVESLGGHSGKRALPVGLVVAAVYSPGAATHLRALTPAHAVLALLKGTAARKRPQAALDALGELAKSAQMFEGERGEARDFAAQLLKMSEAIQHDTSKG